MCSRRSFRALALITLFGCATALHAAGPQSPSYSRDYVPRLDGTPVSITGIDGRLWSAWSYRNRGEFDLAVAVQGLDGAWSPATYIGGADRVDQIDPSIAIDENGTLYLAFATKAPEGVWLAILPAGESTWIEPTLVAPAGGSPVLRGVRDRIVLGYRSGRGVRVLDLPAYSAPVAPGGIQDGPDGVDPLGNSGLSDLPTGGGDSNAPPPPTDDEEPES